MERTELLKLMKATAKATPSNTYSYNGESLSYSAMNEALRRELKNLMGNFQDYRDNKNLVFSLVEETMDEIVPAMALERYGAIAEVKTYPQGTKPVFTRKTGRTRAKQFVTRVGLAGVYEVFKLSGESFEVQTSALGGAAQIGFEEFLDGRADFAEVTAIIMEGMDEAIYREAAKALTTSVGQLPANNAISANRFDEAGMTHLIQTASVYGKPTIYCTYEFAVTMLPTAADWASDAMKQEIWNQGYLGNFKGAPVIVLPQSFEDETNTTKVIDPGYAWVIPAGAEKPVKIAFEGTTHVRERENEDWSRDIQAYRKVGVGVMLTPNVCVYRNTALTKANTPPEIA